MSNVQNVMIYLLSLVWETLQSVHASRLSILQLCVENKGQQMSFFGTLFLDLFFINFYFLSRLDLILADELNICWYLRFRGVQFRLQFWSNSVWTRIDCSANFVCCINKQHIFINFWLDGFVCFACVGGYWISRYFSLFYFL